MSPTGTKYEEAAKRLRELQGENILSRQFGATGIDFDGADPAPEAAPESALMGDLDKTGEDPKLRLQNEIINAQNGDAAAMRLVGNRGAAMNIALERQKEQEEKRKGDDFYRRILDLAAHHNAMADQYAELAREARARMAAIAEEMRELDNFIVEAENIKFDARDGKFDREKAIELLKKRGIEVDDKQSDENLLQRLHEEEKRARHQRAELSDRHDRYQRDAESWEGKSEAERQKAKDLVAQHDAIKAQGLAPGEEKNQLALLDEAHTLAIQVERAKLENDRNNLEEANRLDQSIMQKWRASENESQQDAFLANEGEGIKLGFNEAALGKATYPSTAINQDIDKNPSSVPSVPGMNF